MGTVPRGQELPTLSSVNPRAGEGWKLVWRGGVFGRQNKRNHLPAPSGTQSSGAKNRGHFNATGKRF